jgi:hypothetical protein
MGLEMTLDRSQLVKLLNLTSSKYDAEALNAIRHADALLSKHGTTWADLLALPESAKTPQPESTQAPQQQPAPRPENSATSKTRPVRKHKVRHSLAAALRVFSFPIPCSSGCTQWSCPQRSDGLSQSRCSCRSSAPWRLLCFGCACSWP